MPKWRDSGPFSNEKSQMLLHNDRDFDLMAEVLPELKIYA